MIPESLLKSYQAKTKSVQKGEVIFHAGDHARFYYQVRSGQVKMSYLSEEGKEFIQSIFLPGHSFGEPAIIGGFEFPVDAMATENSEIWFLPKETFMKLLEENPTIHLNVSKALSHRLRYKAIMSSEISTENAPHRIMTLLQFVKTQVYHEIDEPFSFEVQLSRQQIGDLSGLRVETVIRTLKQLELEDKVLIKNRKLYV